MLVGVAWTYGYMVMLLVLYPLQHRFCRWHDTTLCAIGSGFMALSRWCWFAASGNHRWLFELGVAFAVPSVWFFPSEGALFAASVDADEQGKLGALNTLVEQVMDAGTGFIYTDVWRVGISIGLRSLPFSLPALFCTTKFCLLLVLVWHWQRQRKEGGGNKASGADLVENDKGE